MQGADYHSSQPGPFPASADAGYGDATPVPPVLRDGEPRRHGGSRRDELLGGAVLLPPPPTIARRLIDGWLAGREVNALATARPRGAVCYLRALAETE